ncbi:hypothetical protein GFJ93_23025, partial [Salmonella enterica subsp. enterica serovar Enteritidis]|nr:hypothetical protein [Salmonella enterica subsp. enterica serovar Enteritidis]
MLIAFGNDLLSKPLTSCDAFPFLITTIYPRVRSCLIIGFNGSMPMLIPVFLYLATGYPTELWITILPLSAS